MNDDCKRRTVKRPVRKLSMYSDVSSTANLAVIERMGRSDTAVALDHCIVRGFFGDQVQRLLDRLAGRLRAEGFLGLSQLLRVQSGRHLD